MDFLVPVIVMQAALNLVVLVVVVGLARRLRVHSELLAGLVQGGEKLLAVGTVVPEFSARAIDGTTVDRRGLRSPGAVALMAVDCPHCRTNLPEFIAYVRGAGYSSDQVLAVVGVGADSEDVAAAEMLDSLASVAIVVRETIPGGEVAKAFGARAYPCFYLVDADWTVTAGAHAVRRLPNTAARAAAATAARTVGR